MNTLEYWARRIRSDLTPFVDPGTTLQLDRSGAVFDAAWTQRRKPRVVQFVVRDVDGIYVRDRNRELAYRAFFASEDMADIAGIAKTSGDILESGLYVDTLASSDDLNDGSEESAVNIISRLVSRRPEDEELTGFIMVTGEAGAGKTSVLKELVRRQAKLYLAGSTDFVYLYVNAQGRALARFNEALATELNELRVTLPHHAVTPLVKLGLIVPVIDGFDELLGVGGYDDAFSSISSFVQDLEGKGAIVASARSTYYEQEFLSRASKGVNHSEAWRLSSVSVRGWGDQQRRRYVEAKLETGHVDGVEDALKSLNKIFSGENTPLATKPLFVARATDFLLNGILAPDDGALLDRLINAFVLREQREKLLQKSGDAILSSEQIKSLCSDLAEEMWNLGTRELDRATVREIAEYALSDLKLAMGDRNAVIERMPNMAFLQPGDAAGSVAFEHEIFFDYFLSSRIAQAVKLGAASLSLLLGRSSMPDSLAASISQDLVGGSRSEAREVLERLSRVAVATGPRQQLVKENAGRLVGNLLSDLNRGDSNVGDLRLEGLIFPGSRLHGVRIGTTLMIDCEFRRCDFTSTVFDNCVAERVAIELPLMDEHTRFGISGLSASDFIGVRQANEAGVRSVYEPMAVIDLLKSSGLPAVVVGDGPVVRSVDPAVIDLIDRIARAYAKCNPICLQDDFLGHIFNNQYWPAIQKAAVDSGVLREEIRAANGPRREFLRRMVRPEDIAAGAIEGADVPDSVLKFWRELEDVFPT